MSKGKELRRTVLGSETCQRPEDWRKGRSQEAGRDLEPARLEVGLLWEPLKDSELWAMTQMALILEKPLWCSV